MSNFYHTILNKYLGWSLDISVEMPEKCIFCVAPHTSNWDFIMGELYIRSIGKTANFLMKREWFFWPLGILLKRIGGVPVVRDHKTSLTDQLAERAKERETFRPRYEKHLSNLQSHFVLYLKLLKSIRNYSP